MGDDGGVVSSTTSIGVALGLVPLPITSIMLHPNAKARDGADLPHPPTATTAPFPTASQLTDALGRLGITTMGELLQRDCSNRNPLRKQLIRAGVLHTAAQYDILIGRASAFLLKCSLPSPTSASANSSGSASRRCIPTVHQLHTDVRHRVSMGCQALDGVLGGGLVSGSVTEVCGVAGAGKTQLLIQAMLRVQLPPALGGLQGVAVYIVAEDFPAQRVAQLAARFAAAAGWSQDRLLGGIIVRSVSGPTDLRRALVATEGFIQQAATAKVRVRLVVVDSIAAAVQPRDENEEAESSVGRAQLYRQVGAQIQRLASTTGVAVLVANQVRSAGVSTASNNALTAGHASVGQEDDELKPALGPTWTEMVHTRLQLCLTRVCNGASRRRIRVLHSSHLPSGYCTAEQPTSSATNASNLVVDACGIHILPCTGSC